MWSVAVILILFGVLKTLFPLLAFPGNVLCLTQLNSASLNVANRKKFEKLLILNKAQENLWRIYAPVAVILLICFFCSAIIPTYCVSTLTFCKGGAMSQSADTADADADENVDVVLESICFSCPPTIVDEQCKVYVIMGVLI